MFQFYHTIMTILFHRPHNIATTPRPSPPPSTPRRGAGTNDIDREVAEPVEKPNRFKNTKGTELPSTGGMGTTLFCIGGSILVLAAVILPVTKRRMSVNG